MYNDIFPFSKTKIFKLYRSGFYYPMRSCLSMLTVYYVVHLNKSQNVLEIGFYEGLTFGAMIEASPQGANLTTLDINLNKSLYDQHYLNSNEVKNKNISLIELPSSKFIPTMQYDFINVDGGGGEERYNDLVRATLWANSKSIIMLDNYRLLENEIKKFLSQTQSHKFIPFLADDQAMYFHHYESDHNEFLDVHLHKVFNPYFNTSNILYHGYTIKKISERPAILSSYGKNIFLTYCEENEF